MPLRLQQDRTLPRIPPSDTSLPSSNTTIDISLDLNLLASKDLPMSMMSDHVAPRTEAVTLSNIKFHSPSAILGTPLDPTSRFEYPFPASTTHQPSFVDSPHPPISSLPRVHDQCLKPSFALHPQHIARDPPVPPTLVKKCIHFDLQLPLGRTAVSQPPRRRKPEGHVPVKK